MEDLFDEGRWVVLELEPCELCADPLDPEGLLAESPVRLCRACRERTEVLTGPGGIVLLVS